MRVCVVYDCLYPLTVGGAERWYADLTQELADQGHAVTYLTRRQWERGSTPAVDFELVGVGPRLDLYGKDGRRRISQALVFGAGVFLHLLRHGRRYDVVHTASFPYFSLLAAGAVRSAARFDLFVDWHEVWTRDYWRDYLGPLAGRCGWLVQRVCLSVPQQPFCFSELHERRLEAYGVRGSVVRLTGQYAGGDPIEPELDVPPTVVFAGRQLPEKRVLALVPALAIAREQVPGLRAELFGDGPDHDRLVRSIAEHALSDTVTAPGFVAPDRLAAALRRSLCLVLPSRREGYGRVVVEAAAAGVPSVVVDGDDNAAVELVDEGANGFVARSASPEDLAAAIVAVARAGSALRRSTAEWYERNADRLSLARSLETVADVYEDVRERRMRDGGRGAAPGVEPVDRLER